MPGSAPPLRLDRLTALRFPAALGVVLAHVTPVGLAGGIPAHLAYYGGLGVDFFFVLSGFVLAWSYRPSTTPTRFYWLRFSRIWPLHALTLAAVLILAQASLRDPGLIRNIFLVQAWSANPAVYWSFNSPAWTLSCEAFFYAMFPLILPRLARCSPRQLVATGLGALIVPVGLAVTAHFVPVLLAHQAWFDLVFPVSRLPQFVVGMVAALLVRAGEGRLLRGGWPAAAVLVIVLGAGISATTGHAVPSVLLSWAMTPTCALLVAAVASREAETPTHTPRILVFLGAASFALYLTHEPTMGVLSQVSSVSQAQGAAQWLALAVVVAVCMLIAALTHVLLEAPIERRLRALPVGIARGVATPKGPATLDHSEIDDPR